MPPIASIIACLAFSLSLINIQFDTYAITQLLPTLALKWPNEAFRLPWIASIYLIAVAITFIPAGIATDRFGSYFVFLIGIIGFSLGSLGCALSLNLNQLLSFRIIQGLGAGFMLPAGMHLLAQDKDHLGLLMSIALTTSYTAMTLSPSLGRLLIHHLGWPSIFWVSIPTMALVASLVIIQSRKQCSRDLRIFKNNLPLPNRQTFFSQLPLSYWSHLTIASLSNALILYLVYSTPLKLELVFHLSATDASNYLMWLALMITLGCLINRYIQKLCCILSVHIHCTLYLLLFLWIIFITMPRQALSIHFLLSTFLGFLAGHIHTTAMTSAQENINATIMGTAIGVTKTTVTLAGAFAVLFI